MKKEDIYNEIQKCKDINEKLSAQLTDGMVLTKYAYLTKVQDGKIIWTEAFQTALNEHEIVYIPHSDEPYYIDNSLIVPSNRRIEVEDKTVIKLVEGTEVLLIRNKDTADGTHSPIKAPKSKNITVIGGIWEETRTTRGGYGTSGMYDRNRSFYGVSTCMFFNNIENLTIKNVTFVHTGGFAVQVGDIKNAVFENITFVECFADGLHINGNSQNIFIRNVKGQVGDDLVALNMYDWQDSSVNFGPVKTVVCENLELSEDSTYKAFRILPGTYYYDNGSSVDCSAEDIIIKNVKGINTFKMYFQTHSYKLGDEPEKGDVGSVDNIYFENIEIDLKEPIDKFSEYLSSDKIKGSFAAFELGAKIGNISFENIKLKIYKEKWPMSFLVCIGPKSAVINDTEYFNPSINSYAENLYLSNICVNGDIVSDFNDLIHEIVFVSINGDVYSSGMGEIGKITVENK